MQPAREEVSTPAGRVAKSGSEVIDRTKPLKFLFEGREIKAFEGDTIASALYSQGVRIFSRSFKYHRPRGLFCVSGRCANCMMSVNGRPNVRACVEPVREGATVARQNAWPSLEHDIFSFVERISRFLPVGFYYKTFINFPWEWKRVQGFIRRMTGIGSIDQEMESWSKGELKPEFHHEFINADVAVVGGGPAGMVAAREASRLGARVVLIDDQTSLGGHLRFSADAVELDAGTGEASLSGLKEYEAAAELSGSLSTRTTLTILKEATAFGLFESNLLGVIQGTKMIKVRAREVVIATGAFQHQPIFQNNDLPGIIQGIGFRRLVALYGVRPGRSAVVAADSPLGPSLARTLVEAGVKLAAYADVRPEGDVSHDELKLLPGAGVPVLLGHRVVKALGKKRVSGVVLAPTGGNGSQTGGWEKTFECDLLCLDTSLEGDTALLTQTGRKAAYDEGLGEFVVPESKEHVHQCGDVTGIHDLKVTILQGKVAGLTAALGLLPDEPSSYSTQVQYLRNDLQANSRLLADALRRRRKSAGKLTSLPPSLPEPVASKGKTFVCICEDVSAKDIHDAIEEGFDDMETLKRYSTLSMGPCQGKLCLSPSIAMCAASTRRPVGETGRTVSRPPYQPIPMGALAGIELERTKLTAMHHKHLELGATMMDMGEWKRPLVYTTVAEEYRAVREGVGIIDVGTLGRLDVKGADAAKLLDFVYTHSFSKLQPGKVRYGVLCDEAGVILDDGTVTRLSENHYFITTTTGNVDFVEQWLGWWATALRLDAHMTNLTAGMAAVNVAGPKARDLLRKLTDLDLSSAAHPYMASGEGVVAGVPCILLRIGFVGETGWEIHLPAEYGEHFWNALTEGGKEFGLKPFGVETQRVLRLDKKHLIVGQDTDALSNPYEADMAWAVKLEKEDFVGKAALQAIQKKGPERKLVGIVLQRLAREGDQIVPAEGGGPIGFVSSARFSLSAGAVVGMALVPPGMAKEGQFLRVVTEGSAQEARVTLAPFYDPEGKRLRA